MQILFRVGGDPTDGLPSLPTDTKVLLHFQVTQNQLATIANLVLEKVGTIIF
jgi:hypothetical protein